MGKSTAPFVVNKFLENDGVIKSLFYPIQVNVSPGYAPEQPDDAPTFPYIRYIEVPGFDRRSTRIRKDIVQYWIGDKDLDNLIKIRERMLALLNDDTDKIFGGIPDPDNIFNIMNVIFRGATPETIPTQDEGVWELGCAFEIIYTIIGGLEFELVHGLDAIID